MRLHKLLVMGFIFIALASLVLGHSEEGHSNFSQVEEIINNDVPCSQLTDDDLERIGDYYMEQMHPGEAHIQMDQMMGGEDSESLRQMHINMGTGYYCDDVVGAGSSDILLVATGIGIAAVGAGVYFMVKK